MQLEVARMGTIARQEQMYTPWNVRLDLSVPLAVQLLVSARRVFSRIKLISQIATFVPLVTIACRIPPPRKIVRQAVTVPKAPDLPQSFCVPLVHTATSLIWLTLIIAPLAQQDITVLLRA